MRDCISPRERGRYDSAIHRGTVWDSMGAMRPDGDGRWTDADTTEVMAEMFSHLGYSRMFSNPIDSMGGDDARPIPTPATPTSMRTDLSARLRMVVTGAIPDTMDDDDIMGFVFGIPDLTASELRTAMADEPAGDGGLYRVDGGLLYYSAYPCAMTRFAHDGVSAKDAGEVAEYAMNRYGPVRETMTDEGLDARAILRIDSGLERRRDMRGYGDILRAVDNPAPGDIIDMTFHPLWIGHWDHGDTLALWRLVRLMANGTYPTVDGGASAALADAYGRGISSGRGFGETVNRLLSDTGRTGSDSDLVFLSGFAVEIARIISERTKSAPTVGARPGSIPPAEVFWDGSSGDEDARLVNALDTMPDVMALMSSGLPRDFISQYLLSVPAPIPRGARSAAKRPI